ncbi:hypothetical protein CDL12_00148 [Handroanthus impetiginosus]|uniref:BED-type domain-containing protein n=1 Tax=Handroanthus impetiginosus TaxID=429701 RepID=A0A2G9IBN8_9LAMI|nr:hypothetical protein CDL12_00148 [Handroanthus impetiginosus]
MDSTPNDSLDATPNATPSASTQTLVGSVQGTKGNNSDDITNTTIVGRKQRKLKFEVWKHFNREEKPKKIVDASCKYCNKRFDGTSRAGTSHLNNHLKSCIHRKRQFIDISQSVMGKVIGGNDPQPKASIHKFDPAVERALFAKIVAKHDLPFMLCQNTVKSDLMDIYKIENSKIYAEIQSLSCRVTLTTDG